MRNLAAKHIWYIAMHIRQFKTADTEDAVALWKRCGLIQPWNDPYQDISRKLLVQPELFLVGESNGALVATAMAGYDGHRGSVYYLAVDPNQQGKGFGAELMCDIESRLYSLGCPKLSLDVRTTNDAVVGFYQRLGYSRDNVASFAKRLIVDSKGT